MKKTQRTIWVGIFLAVRSLTRGNKGTSVMTIFLMAMIFVNLIFLTAIINGLTYTAQHQIIDTLTGHILVEPEAGRPYVSDAVEATKEMKLVEGVTAVSVRTNFSAEMEFDGAKGSYRGVAIDPADEAAVTTLEDHMVEGRYLQPDDTNALIVGNQIVGGKDVELNAYSLQGVHVGDMVKLRYSNGLEKEYEVVGIFDNDFVQADNRFFISQQEYASLFPEFNNKASEFAVSLGAAADVDTVAKLIVDRNDVLTARTWKETAGVVESFTNSFDIVNVIVSIAALLVAGITIFIVMYIDVVNRKRQIGILRAIGIAEHSISISYLLRSLFYALLGVVLGVLLFKFALIPIFNAHPLRLPLGAVSLVINQQIVYVRALALFIVAFLGAYVPIQRALRMHIIDAIWGK